jgi:hypothetical protein
MVQTIMFSRALWTQLCAHLLRKEYDTYAGSDEQLAFVLAGPNLTETGVRLVARELILAAPDDFDFQSTTGLRPNGEFVARTLSRCRQEGWSLIEVHSHPFDGSDRTSFSGTDWRSDEAKMPRIADLLSHNAYHVTMVMGQSSFDGHYFDRDRERIVPIEGVVVAGGSSGDYSSVSYPSTSFRQGGSFSEELTIGPRHGRQLPLMGTAAQARLGKSRAIVVGLGGLGSFVCLELAHLGIGSLVLVDPDRVEVSNLNRLIGVSESDIGRYKVEVFAKLIQRLAPEIDVIPLPMSILDPVPLAAAKSCDILLGCVDNHGARLVLNQLAAQYIIPYVDAGTGARQHPSRPDSWQVGGQLQVLMPGLGCLECREFIDPARAAFDLAPPEVQAYEREHGYGTDLLAPSVIYLNGILGSLQASAATSLLGHQSAMALPAPLLLYDAAKYAMTSVEVFPNRDCPTCGDEGLAGFADLRAVFEAQKFRSRSSVPALGDLGLVP